LRVILLLILRVQRDVTNCNREGQAYSSQGTGKCSQSGPPEQRKNRCQQNTAARPPGNDSLPPGINQQALNRILGIAHIACRRAAIST
jgi:hypothetical protein